MLSVSTSVVVLVLAAVASPSSLLLLFNKKQQQQQRVKTNKRRQAGSPLGDTARNQMRADRLATATTAVLAHFLARGRTVVDPNGKKEQSRS